MRLLPPQIESLWTLITAPLVWALHFLIVYVGAALYCAKPALLGSSFDAVRIGVAAVTVVALVAITLSAWLAWRQWGFGTTDPPHGEATEESRTLFQGFATLLLSGLSFVAVIYSALPVLFVTECWR